MKIQVTNVALKLKAVILFLEGFLIKLDEKFTNIEVFFKLSENFSTDDLILSFEEYTDAKDLSEEISAIINFLGWVINERYFYKNAFGVNIPLYTVPFKKVLSKRIRNLESVYSAIPYQYISRLKKYYVHKLEEIFLTGNGQYPIVMLIYFRPYGLRLQRILSIKMILIAYGFKLIKNFLCGHQLLL